MAVSVDVEAGPAVKGVVCVVDGWTVAVDVAEPGSVSDVLV